MVLALEEQGSERHGSLPGTLAEPGLRSRSLLFHLLSYLLLLLALASTSI